MPTKREVENKKAQQVDEVLSTLARLEGKIELIMDRLGIEEITLDNEPPKEGEA